MEEPRNEADGEEGEDAVDMAAEIRLYKRAGFADEVVKLQETARGAMEARAKQREAEEAKKVRQKTIGMQMRQRARMAKLKAAHNNEQNQVEANQSAEYSTLVDNQAKEMHELYETVTG